MPKDKKLEAKPSDRFTIPADEVEQTKKQAELGKGEMVKTLTRFFSEYTGIAEADLITDPFEPTNQDQELILSAWLLVDEIDQALDPLSMSVFDLAPRTRSDIWTSAYQVSRVKLGLGLLDNVDVKPLEVLMCKECDLTDDLWCGTELGVCQDCCDCEQALDHKHLIRHDTAWQLVQPQITPICEPGGYDLAAENPALYQLLMGEQGTESDRL